MEDSQHDDWTPDPTSARSPSPATTRPPPASRDRPGRALLHADQPAGDGALHARPMTPQQVNDDLEAWFFISRSSDQADDLAARPG